MLRVLLIDDEDDRAAAMAESLRAAGYAVVARLCANVDLPAKVAALGPDVIIIDVNSPDRDVLEHLGRISRDQPRPIVVFTDDTRSDVMAAALRAGVSAYVVDGLAPQRVKPVVEMAIQRFREHAALKHELDMARSELAERKHIERAKGLLMARRGLSEEAAYGYLRKTAMDRGQRLAEVARNVLALADLIG